MQDLSPVATPLVLIEDVEPGIARLTLNRPEARNALSRALIQDLHDSNRAARTGPVRRRYCPRRKRQSLIHPVTI